MKWTKEVEYANGFERWALVDNMGIRRAVVDHNLKRQFKGRRVWEYSLNTTFGRTLEFKAFPRGSWSIEKRLNYVAVIVRML